MEIRAGMIDMHTGLMYQAIDVAKKGIAAGQSPFGAVIATKAGEVVLAVHNLVRADCDSTAHAEIVAIRGACAKLRRVDLSGHLIVSTCEPCPMCAAAIHWSRLDAVIYGATIEDACAARFNELSFKMKALYSQGASTVRVHSLVLRDECKKLFGLWKEGPNPNPY